MKSQNLSEIVDKNFQTFLDKHPVKTGWSSLMDFSKQDRKDIIDYRSKINTFNTGHTEQQLLEQLARDFVTMENNTLKEEIGKSIYQFLEKKEAKQTEKYDELVVLKSLAVKFKFQQAKIDEAANVLVSREGEADGGSADPKCSRIQIAAIQNLLYHHRLKEKPTTELSTIPTTR